MSKQIARRTSDRVVEQFGESIGERQDCVVESLTDPQYEALYALSVTPHGGIVANADGTFTALPPTVRAVANCTPGGGPANSSGMMAKKAFTAQASRRFAPS